MAEFFCLLFASFTIQPSMNKVNTRAENIPIKSTVSVTDNFCHTSLLC